ncbi:M23 family metallopeptidase [Puniceibacterium confluentis]|uniref:M23 family metallopeptidase n=1 Tax=Puniceibacterium confluentis TaxID=1958944 RepID=UPI0011B53B86|nr:M23 family metallopeptidase [Puniceibacterium confluentis]
MRARAFVLALTTSATPTVAEVPFLDLPLDCVLGQTCFIEDYVDADPGIAQRDYTCGLKSRDGHKGTDIALISEAAMDAGANVLAAAPGVVEATRDDVTDRPYSAAFARELDGRECGNAVRLRHENGFQTLYCHMKKGSLTVQPGTVVRRGQPLGQVGMSGQSNFAHVHITVLKDGQVVDPFNPAATGSCGTATASLWNDPPAYAKAGLFTASFSTSVPSLAHVQSGAARRDTARPDHSLVLYGFAFFAETGDVMSFSAVGPDGEIFTHSETIDPGQAQLFRAYGRRAPAAGWPVGSYTGTVRLDRDGTLLALRHATIWIAAH